jgi:hypothetical protein
MQLSKQKRVMTRKASDNKYLHKDFHVSMSILLKCIYNNFGKEELVNDLTQYADVYDKHITVHGISFAWQRFISRLVLHGLVTLLLPESILQT